jgi:hypothetical protein
VRRLAASQAQEAAAARSTPKARGADSTQGALVGGGIRETGGSGTNIGAMAAI